MKEKRPSHGYYRTLYGDVDRNLDVALASSVVFEDVVLPAADLPYPEFEAGPGDSLRLPALGMTTEWQFVTEAQRLLEPSEDELLRDSAIAAVLSSLPKHARPMALLYAATDVLLAQAHEAPVLCAKGRRRLVLRLIELGVTPLSAALAAAIERSGGLVDDIGHYTDVVSLKFLSQTVESLAFVKRHEKVRGYAEQFQQVLVGGVEAGPRLFEAIGGAWESGDLAEQVGGAFSATRHVMGPLGLLPGVGTIAAGIGMGADAGAELAARRAEKFRWYELGPQIRYIESLRDLEDEARRQKTARSLRAE